MATRMETLVELMQKQIAQKEEELKLQREEMDKRSEEMQRRSEDMERMHGEERDAAEKRHQEQMKMILEKLGEMKGPGAIQTPTPSTTPNFPAFGSSSELWTDYWSRFITFTQAHLASDKLKAQVFLTNQSSTVYKMLSNLSGQQTPPKDINKLIFSVASPFSLSYSLFNREIKLSENGGYRQYTCPHSA